MRFDAPNVMTPNDNDTAPDRHQKEADLASWLRRPGGDPAWKRAKCRLL
jgi:hypothetical protein